MKKEMILQLASKLKEVSRVEFEYNNSFYEIFESTEGGYMINIYSSNEKDEVDTLKDEVISLKNVLEFKDDENQHYPHYS